MVLSDNVESLKSGAILVSKGTVLNKRLLGNPKSRGKICFVMIQKDSEDLTQNSFVIRYEMLSDKMENVFLILNWVKDNTNGNK